jgi:hypothetical protein
MQPTTYIVKTKAAETAGGVELEYIEIIKFATVNGVKAVSATSDQILQVSKLGDRVFVQQEGRLSLDYRLWALELLNRGVIILEKNVFSDPWTKGVDLETFPVKVIILKLVIFFFEITII